jgi:hypothetical protein
MNVSPTARGFAIIIVIAAAITAFQLQIALSVVLTFLQVLFLVAIAYTLYRLWRDRREEISMWSRRARAVFYGAALLAIVNVALAFTPFWPEGGLEALIFFVVLGAAAFAMWRVWRDEHTYGY